MSRPPELPDFPASQLFLRRLAYSLVHDEARAEDLVQETWTAWVEHRPRNVAEPRAWLARVLRNRAFNAKRSDARRAQREALAGQPDPSAPETDGTLEAQAQLIEALRKLEEPYRSTLVQRYYHDLPPKEIAERSGAPLNTVKARLARGLEKLRGEMDRRYRGDRGAWCHWLVSLAHPPVAAVPGAPTGMAAPLLPDTGLGALFDAAEAAGTRGAPAALGSWIFLAGMLVSGVGWVLWRSTRHTVPSVPVEGVTYEPRAAPVLAEPRREAVRPDPRPVEREEAAAVVPPDEAPQPAAFALPLPFEWPQLGGMPTHDNFGAFRDRIDLIQRPRILWHRPGFEGQVTISGTELYSGGRRLFRMDLVTGEVSNGSDEIIDRCNVMVPRWPDGSDWWLARHGLTPRCVVAAAPALTDRLVLSRFVRDGSVSAFDRDLARELWRWEPTRPAPCPLTCCLVGERVLVAHGSEVVSLGVGNGAVDWRFDVGPAGAVDMVPASDGDLVFFATSLGVVICLDLARGKEQWRVHTGRAYRMAYPVMLEDRVVFADDGLVGETSAWRTGELRSFQSYDGRELWRVPVLSHSSPGAGEGTIFVSTHRDHSALSLMTGTVVSRLWSEETIDFACAPTLVGGRLYSGENSSVGSLLNVRDLQDRNTAWSFDLGSQVQVHDLVHAGDRVYVASSAGLYCLGDDPDAEPAPEGFVLRPAGAGATLETRKARPSGSRSVPRKR